MRPSHRLDLVLVPSDPVRPSDGALRLLEDLVSAEVIDASGAPGPRALDWCDGGFARVSLDRPVTAPDGLAFWSNRQGGFRVTCPETRDPLVPAFSGALARWRAGGPRSVPCPACGGLHPLEELGYAPRAAFGPWAVVTGAAGASALTAEGQRAAARRLGAFEVVLRRG